jgi:tetratricopeptide (TPR) repeat protein
MEMTENNEAMERFEAGNLHMQESRHEEAMEEFREAVRVNEDFAEAYNNLGLALFYQGRFEEAVAEFRNAFRINPAFAMAHTNLGLAFLNNKLTDEAITEFNLALSLDSDNTEAYYNLGIAYVSQGLINEAIRAYEGFLEHAPEQYGNYIEGVKKILEQLKLKVEGA